MNTTSNFQVRSGKSGEINSPSCGFKSPNNFSPGLPYSSGLFSHISEIGSERITINTCDYGSHKNGNSESHFYTPFVSGYEPADLNDNFPGVKNNKHIKLFACSNSTEFQVRFLKSNDFCFVRCLFNLGQITVRNIFLFKRS